MPEDEINRTIGAHTEAIKNLKEITKDNSKKIDKVFYVSVAGAALSGVGVVNPEITADLIAAIVNLFA